MLRKGEGGLRRWDHMAEELEAVALVAVWQASLVYDAARSKSGRVWASYATWVVQVRLIDYLRENGQTRRNGRERYPSTNYFRYEPGIDPLEAAARHEPEPDAGKISSSLLRGLNAGEKEVVRMRFEQGLTQQEIADRIGVSEGRVSQKLKEIFAVLRESLACVA
jgi:RNA polymerase sigma factor (sigma-70 family)